VLALELKELQIALPEFNLDISATGFNPDEIDSILLDFPDGEPGPADEVPEPEANTIAQKGDLFVLGGHRLLVGDARDDQAFIRLMKGTAAEMAFLDPPYNTKVHGHTGGRGRIKHREFECASGELTSPQYVQFLKETLGRCAHHAVDGSIFYICTDWRHTRELHEASAGIFDLKNVCVWVKTNAGQGSFYRSQHELIFVYKRGNGPHINTFELGQHGRSRSNVWRYSGQNTFRSGRMAELEMHPTVKPVALVVDAMRDCSKRNSVILDAFAGSGTTLVAAEQIGRRAYCMEIDAQYADTAVRRWQRLTGRDAILESTKQTFDDVSITRKPKSQRVK
jgi:DNA modification methylase